MSLARPLSVLGLSCAFTGSAVAYVHWVQNKDQQTMKENVFRDIAMEKLEKETEKRAKDRVNGNSVEVDTNSNSCETGLCDLKQSRIKED
mmetsp:Transcript_28450/g.34732  ORF Transcript_28450/g.34732 Transcript_28450/m.34732 type:complete len:90 (-) Transcript_28450:1344-1613(-)